MKEKNNTKRAAVQADESKKKTLPRGKVTPSEQGPSVEEIWREELSALAEQRFESLDRAIESIVARVVARVGKGMPQNEASKIKEFMTTLLATDEQVRESLRPFVK